MRAVSSPMRDRQILRALRPLDWTRNALVFAPLALSHHLNDVSRLTSGLVAFAAFCFVETAINLQLRMNVEVSVDFEKTAG